jgi:hypothetical protein
MVVVNLDWLVDPDLLQKNIPKTPKIKLWQAPTAYEDPHMTRLIPVVIRMTRADSHSLAVCR